MSTESISIDIQLSGAELLYLQDSLSLKPLIGGTSADGERSEETTAIWRFNGLNALRARGFVIDDHATEQMAVDRTLAGMLITCANARRAIYVDRRVAGVQFGSSCLHIHDALTVVHRRERPGVDRFMTLLTPGTMVEQIRHEVLLASEGLEQIAPMTLPRSAFTAALAELESGRRAQAQQALVAMELSEASAEALIQALSQPYANNSVMGIAETGDTSRPDRFDQFTLIDAPEGIWLIEFAQAGDITVQRVSRELAYARLDRLLALIHG